MNNSPTPGNSTDLSEAVVQLLRDPSTHSDASGGVHVIETHISWIFLTDRHAYKLKKPVRYDFLDFSTLAARQAACEEELRANRRLAASVYLALLPVTVDRHSVLRLAGEGKIVDWVVQMRRLRADRTLDELIRAGTVRPADIEAVANRLTHFFRQSPPLSICAADYRQMILRHVRANRETLLEPTLGLSADKVKRAHAAQLRLIEVTPEVLDRRVAEGRIIDGHGDLRPEHIYLDGPPVVIDCIEFNRDFRQLDVADDLCFLAMECDFWERPDVGRRILEVYIEASDDAPPTRLLHFYRSYRACVRAKVEALRAAQLAGAEAETSRANAERYLDLADQDATGVAPPLLAVVRGLSGTGKSTLAAALSDHLGLDLLRTDVLRRDVLGETPDAYGSDPYRPEARDMVYEEMFRRASMALRGGVSIVLDGTFLSAASRERARDVAAREGATLLVVECRCPAKIARQRIIQRLAAGHDPSEARADLPDRQADEQQPDPPGLESCAVDTTLSLPDQLSAVVKCLARQDAAAFPDATRPETSQTGLANP